MYYKEWSIISGIFGRTSIQWVSISLSEAKNWRYSWIEREELCLQDEVLISPIKRSQHSEAGNYDPDGRYKYHVKTEVQIWNLCGSHDDERDCKRWRRRWFTITKWNLQAIWRSSIQWIIKDEIRYADHRLDRTR